MAQLLVRSVAGENAQRYTTGDIVMVVEDGHQWGRCESLDVWVAEGLDPAEWPGGFTIIHLPDLPADDVKHLAEAGQAVRRLWTVDIQQVAEASASATPLGGKGQADALMVDEAPTSTIVADPAHPDVIGAFSRKIGVAG